MTLKLDNIWFSYQNGLEKVNLLNGVEFSVETGKVTALLGSNGAGKTTLLNIISGFEKNYTGKILLDERDITRLPVYEIARLGVLRMFQKPQLTEGQTLLENMVMMAQDHCEGENPFKAPFLFKRIGKHEMEKAERAVSLLRMFFGNNLEEVDKYISKLNESVAQLSLGEQRIMGFIGLLMNECDHELLLLDEPTSGISLTNMENMKKVLRDRVANRHTTVLLVSHDMGFIRNLADTCVYLDYHTGKTELVASPEKVLADENVRKNYLGYESGVGNK